MSNKGKGQGHSKPPKFTAQELMDLHGLTVEQALTKGYEVVGHKTVCDDKARQLNRERARRHRERKKEDKSNGNQLQRTTY